MDIKIQDIEDNIMPVIDELYEAVRDRWDDSYAEKLKDQARFYFWELSMRELNS